MLPSAAARDLDNDVSHTSYYGLLMSEYSRALADYDSADKRRIDSWGESSPIMRAVEANCEADALAEIEGA